MTYKIYIPLFLIIIFTCSNKNKEKKVKEYTLITVEKTIHSEQYSMPDENGNIQKTEYEDVDAVYSQISIQTNDSIYIGSAQKDENPIYSFELYTIKKINKHASVLKWEAGNDIERLFLYIDIQNNILKINENKYYLNKSYTEYLLKEGFRKNTILPFVNFINEYIDDFYPFHMLSKSRWIIQEATPAEHKILYAETQTEHPQISNKFYNWKIEYTYRKNNSLTKIIKYESDDKNTEYYYYELIDQTPEYDYYQYSYNDELERFNETGNGYTERMHFSELFCISFRDNVQKGWIDESKTKINNRKIYPVHTLSLTAKEIYNIISEETNLSSP